MQVISTHGPDQATKALLPFMAAKGAMKEGDAVDLFLMQEATYLASERHADLGEIKAPGLPTVAEAVDLLLDEDAIRECVVCVPCAEAREIDESDLRPWATLGRAPALARQAAHNDATVTF